MAGTDPVSPDQARLIFLRPVDRGDGTGGGPVFLRLDNELTGRIAYREFLLVDSAPGPTTLMVSGRLSVLGTCAIEIEAPAGQTLHFAVGPRKAHLIASLLGSVAGVALIGDTVSGSVGEAIFESVGETAVGSELGAGTAAVVEGRGRPCRGPYRVVPIDKDTAERRLSGLRLTRE